MNDFCTFQTNRALFDEVSEVRVGTPEVTFIMHHSRFEVVSRVVSRVVSCFVSRVVSRVVSCFVSRGT
jgi:ribosome-associated toxin RatA of RatAB toxin-antitoxin module